MKQRIIIIGGMGPQASLELHRRMIQQALTDGAKDGTDFPHIVHLSLPVPDFIANESRRSEALEIIINELKNIDASMDDVIIIACNTAHLLQPDIEQRLNIRITSMVDAAIDYVSRHYKTIRLLASPTTIRTGLYDKPLKAAGVTDPLAIVSKQKEFDITILVKGGGLAGQVDAIKLGIAKALTAAHADLRPVLKKAELLKRDPREKERKKYGLRSARKREQFSKR